MAVLSDFVFSQTGVTRPAIGNVSACAPKNEDYPAAAVRAEATGVTRIRFTVDATGSLSKAEVISSAGTTREHQLLDELALTKLSECKFKPGLDGSGKSIGGTFVVDYRWMLENPQVLANTSIPSIENPAQCTPKNGDYPAAAIRAEVQGTTRIRFTVDATSKLTNIEVVSPAGSSREHRQLDRVALSKLSECRFRAGISESRVPIGGTFEVGFVWRLPPASVGFSPSGASVPIAQPTGQRTDIVVGPTVAIPPAPGSPSSPGSQPTQQSALTGNAFGQSNLPPCPKSPIWDSRRRCWGEQGYTFGSYVGETLGGRMHGLGMLTFVDGSRHVGEFQDHFVNGQGIRYNGDGSVRASGRWIGDRLEVAQTFDPRRFPFDADKAERERQTATRLAAAEGERRGQEELRTAAAVEEERKKRLELEQRLAAAEARERERLQAQAQPTPQPQRPQVAVRPERRVALIVGNAAYKISPLDNPVNDATDVDAGLKRAGFQTTLLRNATLAQMREATRRFADQLTTADVALIYFAGHGIESRGRNYMVPVNADLKFEHELLDQAFDANLWLEMLEGVRSANADRVNIVILDACRNNNLIGARSLSRGLGRLDAPSGTFLAYSTAPGKVAADGPRGQRNSPFTKHLLQAMQQPNQPIEEVFKEVRRNVSRETAGTQVPWESTSLTGFFSFRPER